MQCHLTHLSISTRKHEIKLTLLKDLLWGKKEEKNQRTYGHEIIFANQNVWEVFGIRRMSHMNNALTTKLGWVHGERKQDVGQVIVIQMSYK